MTSSSSKHMGTEAQLGIDIKMNKVCALKSLKQAEGKKLANIDKRKKQLPSYLKSNDKTKSDGNKLPVEQSLVSIVVSVRFISKK